MVFLLSFQLFDLRVRANTTQNFSSGVIKEYHCSPAPGCIEISVESQGKGRGARSKDVRPRAE